MATGVPGIGMVRFLSIGVGLNDQFSAAAARLNAQVHGLSTSFAGVDKHMNLIRSKMILLGFATATVVGGIAAEFAQQQRQLTLAAFAAGDYGTEIGRVEEAVTRLSKGLKASPTEMARLVKQTEQLGVGNIEGAAEALSYAGGALALVTDQEVEASMAAETIFRLSSATARSNEEFEALVRSAPAVASAINEVGKRSAAGTPDILAMIASLQPLGTIAGFSTAQLIALAGGLGDVNSTSRELFRTALMRMFGDSFIDPEKVETTVGMLRQLESQAGLTTAEFHEMRRERPFELLLLIAEAMKTFPKGERVELLQAMGLTQRDAVTLSAVGQSLGKIGEMYAVAQEQMGMGPGKTVLEEHVDILNNQLLGAWDGFIAAVKRAAKAIGAYLNPVLMPLLQMLESLFTTISESKILTGALTFTGLSFVVGQMFRLGAMLAPMAKGAFSILRALLGGDAMLSGGRPGGLMATVIQKMTRSKADNIIDALFLGSSFLNAKGAAMRGKGFFSRMLGRVLGGTGALGTHLAGAKGRYRTVTGMYAGATPPQGFWARLGARSLVRGEAMNAAMFGGTRLGAAMGARMGVAAIPVVGQILAAVMLLAPVLTKMGDLFDYLAEKAGPLGFIFRIVGLVFHTLGLIGNALNVAVDWIIGALSKAIDFILKWTGIGLIAEGLDKLFNWADDAVVGANKRVTGDKGWSQNNVTFNINAGDGAASDAIRAGAQRSTTFAGWTSAPAGG